MNKVFSNGLEYRVLAENKLSLCGIGSCADENIIVPEIVDGAQVISVDSGAFAHATIKSVTLPLSVDYIGAEAFAWCKELCSVTLGGVKFISERVFMGCDSLENISLGNDLELIGEKAFAYCSALEKISIPKKVYSIGASAFEGCSSLISISLPDSLKVIENGTFYACTTLRSINLPSALEYINEFAFAYCISLDIQSLPIKTIINRYAFFECYQHVS